MDNSFVASSFERPASRAEREREIDLRRLLGAVRRRKGWVIVPTLLAAGVAYFALAMFFFVIGFWAATVFKRFGGLVTTVTLVGVGLLLVLVVWLITVTRSWQGVADIVLALGALGIAVCGIVLTAVLATSSFATLRRAVP